MEKEKVEIIKDKLIASKQMLVITGPTASGKTSLAIRLADYFPIEIVSSDSRQFYKFLNIGTAKPSVDELERVKHHFIDFLEPDEEYNAGKFGEDASRCVAEIFERGFIPVVVGGSGLYLKSLTEGLFDEQEIDENQRKSDLRRELNKKLELEGKESLYNDLMHKDPLAAELYPDKNPRRVLRALEYFYLTGHSIINSRKANKTERNFNFIQFGINFERSELYDRINKRVIRMWNDGLLEELKNIIDHGYPPDLNSLNTVGYKEAGLYLTGYLSEEETIEEIQKNTRRYAKRQLTWLKKDLNMFWLDPANGELNMLEQLLNHLLKEISVGV